MEKANARSSRRRKTKHDESSRINSIDVKERKSSPKTSAKKVKSPDKKLTEKSQTESKRAKNRSVSPDLER